MKRVVVSAHSQHDQLAAKITDALKSSGHDVITMNEARPQALKGREQAMKWCEVFVQVASIRYQREPFLLELANYAKTLRKPIITVLGQSNYKPSGALGAIAVAGVQTIDFTKADQFDSSFELLKNHVEAVTEASSAPKPGLANAKSLNKPSTTPGGSSGIFISYENDSKNMADVISGALQQAGSVVKGSPSKNNDQAIAACRVFVAVLSPKYEASEECRRSYELARLYRKTIIPVIGAKGYQPGKWLALAIAGKLYYNMPDQETAYKAFYDSTLMNDFCYAIKAFLQPHASEEERERSEIEALDKQLEECKGKLTTWPPTPRPRDVEETAQAVEDVKIGDDKSKLVFNYIHHEVTRMSFVPPKPLFDARGVPLRRTFDVMCSYQWSIQQFVRDFYMDLHMRNVEVWMDIWGGMQGNINESMANAVECSSAIVCFLTEKYQQSVNCCLELKYAIQRKKPIIFIKVEPALALLPWIADAVAKSNIFEMSSISDAGTKDNGIPRINRIAELIRAYSTTKARRAVNDEVTEEVFELREMLEDALYWVHKGEGTARFSKCGRCGAEFDENSTDGCKKHGAYFMGGTILAGRWVCCQQRDKNSPGCEKATHTTTEYKWKQIPNHGGCFKWMA